MMPLPDIGGSEEPRDGWLDGLPDSVGGFSATRLPVAGGVCLAIVGEVDLANAADFLAKLKAAAANDEHFVVDLSGLRYIDSSGIRAIMCAHGTLKLRKLRMSLGGPALTVKKVLELMGVAEIVPIFDTVDAALRDLAEHT